MLVLGIETSTRLGSVGVVEHGEGGDEVVLAEVLRDSGLRHGAALLGLVDEALGAAGCDLASLDAIAVAIGPGSFTGLRVALATGKGLVLGTRTRLVGVPTLAALAEATLRRLQSAGEPAVAAGTVLAPCLDARRGEVYGACFSVREPARAGGGVLAEIEPAGAFLPAEFARVVARCVSGAPAFAFGEGAERHRPEIEVALAGTAAILDEPSGWPSGAAVASLGARADGSPGDAACLAPVYVRSSDAERNRDRSSAGTRAAGGGTRPR